jgi:peroxiredoxin
MPRGVFFLRKLMIRLWSGFSFILLLGLGLLVCPSLQAGMVGDEAPELQIKEWIQGGPINLKDAPGKGIYVIEFWQTECPHCLESLPYLSILQEQYKKDGVVFIGITGEDAAVVRTFLEKNKDAGYALAVDDDDKTYEQFMGAFGVSGVPHAFVIGRQGRVLWEGHPMGGLDKVLPMVVADRYDLEEAQNTSRARKLFTAYIYLSVETDETDVTREVGLRVFAYGRGNAEVMYKLARFIVSNGNIRKPDTELGVRAAKRAYDLTAGTDREIIETYAGALYLSGAKKQAKEFLRKATALK